MKTEDKKEPVVREGVTILFVEKPDGDESRCADCGAQIGQDEGPPDGWQLEDGRTVCHACCVKDTRE